jgi:16S rRNA (cytosine967-C5)-methyltransferase
MMDSGLLAACDVRAKRVMLLRQNVRASGAQRVHVVHVDTQGAVPFAPVFNRVLVDAPCSGLGTVRRDPDIRWRRTEEELPALASSQLRLLGRAAEVVAPGGRLVYATCSSEPEENELVVEAFIAAHPEFESVDLREQSPAAIAPYLDARGMMRTLPFRDNLEAFFAAAMRRR